MGNPASGRKPGGSKESAGETDLRFHEVALWPLWPLWWLLRASKNQVPTREAVNRHGRR